MKKKRIVVGIIVLLLMIGIGVGIWIVKREAAETVVESAEQAVAGKNQQISFGQIISIEGNELRYISIEESSQIEENSQMEESSQKEADEDSKSTPLQFGNQSAEQPVSDMESMKDMKDMDAIKDMKKMEDVKDTEATQNTEATKNTTVTETMEATENTADKKNVEDIDDSEVRTTYIPVGTEVVTKLGTVTTFVKLKAEDEIQILTEKVGEEDVIIKIWIIG